MRWKTIILILLCVTVPLCAKKKNKSKNPWDTACDQQITQAVQSQSFTNQVITYPFQKKKWLVRVIRIPNNETLKSGSVSFNYPVALVTKDLIPQELFTHLEQLVERASTEEGCFFSNGSIYNGSSLFDSLANPQVITRPKPKTVHSSTIIEIPSPEDMEKTFPCSPIATANSIADPKVDALIQEIFKSEKFRNEVFHYNIEGKTYKVRIIYNPHYLPIYASQKFKLYYGEERLFKIPWEYKYGIISEEMPRELIEHITSFIQLSWYDWYYGLLDICNGGKVSVEILYRKYETISWFHFMSTAAPSDA